MSAQPRLVDVRGPRFAASVTAVVLAVALVLGSGVLVAVQAAVFAVGAFAGLRYAPYGAFFRLVVAPRLGPVREREPEAPSPPGSRSWRPCSTRSRASAWAASST